MTYGALVWCETKNKGSHRKSLTKGQRLSISSGEMNQGHRGEEEHSSGRSGRNSRTPAFKVVCGGRGTRECPGAKGAGFVEANHFKILKELSKGMGRKEVETIRLPADYMVEKINVESVATAEIHRKESWSSRIEEETEAISIYSDMPPSHRRE